MIQYRLLNKSRGPAVQSPRIQADKFLYAQTAQYTLEKEKNLHIYQDTVVDVISSPTAESGLVDGGTIQAVLTARGRTISARAVVLTTGTFMEGKIYIGEFEAEEGRLGEKAAIGLGTALARKGFTMSRLKTGTPCRVLRKSVDLSQLEIQEADAVMRPFSFDTAEIFRPSAVCYVCYTNEHTHEVIRQNFHRSPLFSGKIHATGARYCPSIEDKVRKFPERTRHQLYIEPEGLTSDELYINGFSSSLPEDVQDQMLRTLTGFADAVITRPAYAVDYAVVSPLQLGPDLQTRRIAGLFTAGQINGTSGYEEAGAQGLLAGINAARRARDLDPWYPEREQAYLGVLIDDLITQGTREPYRMFTSRAEHRLLLREDNADARLTAIGYELGVVDEYRYRVYNEKMEAIAREQERLRHTLIRQEHLPGLSQNLAASELLKRPEIDYATLAALPGFDAPALDEAVIEQIDIAAKYAGYIERQQNEVAKLKENRAHRLPVPCDYRAIHGLSAEVAEKLDKIQPENLDQAARIPGVTPAALSILLIHLKKQKSTPRDKTPQP